MSEKPVFNCEPCKFTAKNVFEWFKHTEKAKHIKLTGGVPRKKGLKHKCLYCSKTYAFLSKLHLHMLKCKSEKEKVKDKEDNHDQSSDEESEDNEKEDDDETVSNEIINKNQNIDKIQNIDIKNISPDKILAQKTKVITNANGEKVNICINVIDASQDNSEKEKNTDSEIVEYTIEEIVKDFLDKKRETYKNDEEFHNLVYSLELINPRSPPVEDTNRMKDDEPEPDFNTLLKIIRNSRKMRKVLFSYLYELIMEDSKQNKIVDEVHTYAQKRGFDTFVRDDFNLSIEGRNKIYLRSIKARENNEGGDISGYSRVLEKESNV